MELIRIDQTNGIELTGSFLFTISPDDQWLVFFWAGNPREPTPTGVHYLYGHLRALNLRSGEIHAFTLLEDQMTDSMRERAEASWAYDSSICLLPPPGQTGPRVLISFPKDGKPSISFPADPHKSPTPALPANDQITMPQQFSCSDCFSNPTDIDLLKSSIPAQFQFFGTVTPEETIQALSPDRKKVFFQKGPQGKQSTPEGYQDTALFERDVLTGAERLLASHHGINPYIDRLRPSPDGKKLAYQLTTGGNFRSVPEIYVVDLVSG